MDALVILVALVALAFAALRWGIDTTDSIASPEWQRRRAAKTVTWLSTSQD